MKLLLALALTVVTPAMSWAQGGNPAKPVSGKPAAKKSKTGKVTHPARPQRESKAAATRRSALKAVEEVTPVDRDADTVLSAQDMETAARVYVGVIPCELGAAVTVTADANHPGFFAVQTKGGKFRMHPVESRTGAIRLEDPRAGAMWLQLGNKSMLMSQKLGQRLADECMSPAQITFADEMKKNPPASILEALPIPKVTEGAVFEKRPDEADKADKASKEQELPAKPPQ